MDQLLLCEFRLSQPLGPNAPLVGSRVNMELEVPASYVGGSVGTLRFTGRVVVVNEATQAGWINVVCQVEKFECGTESGLSVAI